MANGERESKDSPRRERDDGRSELTEALRTVESMSEALRKKRQPESTVLQLNCWSGGSNTGSSACWDGDRVARLKVAPLRSPRPCAQRQRSRLTERAAACPPIEIGDYWIDSRTHDQQPAFIGK
jgi:hypothetical protein